MGSEPKTKQGVGRWLCEGGEERAGITPHGGFTLLVGVERRW